MFEFRLRILDVGEGREAAFLGIVEGFPQILVHATTSKQTEVDLVRALNDHIELLMNRTATRLELDDYPTVRVVRIYLTPLGS
jgi:hypothetical protein